MDSDSAGGDARAVGVVAHDRSSAAVADARQLQGDGTEK